MTNSEKAREIAENSKQYFYHDEYECGLACALRMAQWKDEQFKHLLIEKTKLLSSSAAQDSVKRCMIEGIYRELFNEEMPNSNPYMK